MHTLVEVDDLLLTKASEATGITERETLVRDGLQALIQREAARALIALGGSDPHATAAPRRRFD